MIGFDFARTFNPAHRIGTATGIVNVGGFIAALVAIYLIGVVLDILHSTGFSHGELYGLEPFRIALCVQFLLLGVGVGRHAGDPPQGPAADGGPGRGGAAAAAGHGPAAQGTDCPPQDSFPRLEALCHSWRGCCPAGHCSSTGAVIHLAPKST